MKDAKNKLKDFEGDVRKQAAEARKKINSEAARVSREIRGDRGGEKAERLRRVASWKKSELARVATWEANAKKTLAEQRKRVDDAIEKNRQVVARNRKVLIDQNRGMLETLFHESFHAFSYNFLWKGSVPRWLDEGFASYYEMSAVEMGELIHGTPHPAYLALLKKSLADGGALDVKTILAGDAAAKFLVAHDGDADRANLHYALSWLVAHHMVGKIPPARIDAYVAALQIGADPIVAFEGLMGKPLVRVETDLRRHLATLK